MNQIDPNEAVDFLYKNASQLAKAKANRVYMEEFRKSLKALLMAECQAKTNADREQWAYAHDDYIAHLKGLQVAVEEEEKLRWQMVSAEARIAVWRSQEASNRTMDRATQ